MADESYSDFTARSAALTVLDLLAYTDTSDTTDSADGTTKKITPDELAADPLMLVKSQVTPTAETTAVTLTIAKLLTKIITGTHATGANINYQLPTGTLSDAGATFATDSAFDWVLINLSAAAADTITITVGADHSIVGNPIVQSAHNTTGGIYGNSAVFRSRRTAADTFITYRVG